MKKITLLFTLIFGFSAFAQLSQDFEGVFPPTDWTIESTSVVETYHQNTLGIGTGNSAQVLYDFGQDESLISPVFTVPTGNSVLTFDVSLSYYWSIDPNENYDAIVSVSNDGGFSWTQIWDETVLGVFTNYLTYNIVVPLTTYSGQNVKLKFQYVGDDGASLDFDNVVVMSAPATVPNCASVVSPLDGATNVATGIVTFEWAPSTTGEIATSYDLYSGLTAGNATNLIGNYTTTTADIAVTGFSTTFYWKVIAKNLAGEAIGCSEWSFTTGVNPGYCLNGVLYPSTTFTPNCNGLDNAITTAGYAGEYSNVNVVSGTTYIFKSGTSDFITIANDAGNTSILAGATPQTWTSNVDGVIRFYSHVDENCGEAQVSRTRSVSCGTPPPSPANDICMNAIAITAGTVFADNAVVGTTNGATTTAGIAVTCQPNHANEVWYSLVVPDSTTLTIETDATIGSTMTDSVLSVFSGTCDALAEIGCDDDTGNGNFSKVSLTGLTPGNTIYIGVWRYSLGVGIDGDFQLSAYDASLATSTFDNASFSYYPNPVKNILNISYNKNITKVAVYNLIAQEVTTKSINTSKSQIDMSNLSSGTYLVKVTADNQVKTIKVVKE